VSEREREREREERGERDIMQKGKPSWLCFVELMFVEHLENDSLKIHIVVFFRQVFYMKETLSFGIKNFSETVCSSFLLFLFLALYF